MPTYTAPGWRVRTALLVMAAGAATGCASGKQVASLSAPSDAPGVYAIAGSSSPPVSPEAAHTGNWPPLPTPATSAIGCQSGVVTIANVWYAHDSYLCVYRRTRIEVTLFNYPSGWSTPVVAPQGAAKLTALKDNPDGSQATAITANKAGGFTVTTQSLDNLAVSANWTLHVTVRP